MLSQGKSGPNGICGFGLCIDDAREEKLFDGRDTTQQLFQFNRFVGPNFRVLVGAEETRAILGAKVRNQSSGCTLDMAEYDLLMKAATATA